MNRQQLITRIRERTAPTLDNYALLFDSLLAVLSDDQLDELVAQRFAERIEVAEDLIIDLWRYIEDRQPHQSIFDLRRRVRRFLPNGGAAESQ
ncbi:MAG: hypothetical protein JWL84_4410 [Rhodospirillales bacterium]|jgi:hypothetical protein|nr:hypothetical protein [Rhodospirillales bacterium]